MSLFADDTKLYANPFSGYNQLQTDLQEVAKWVDDWCLQLNTSKCAVLHLGKNNPRNRYVLSNVSLKTVSQQKDLGVLVTETLSWSEHIQSVCNKARTSVYLLSKTFSKISPKNFVALFSVYVRPILEFAGPVWNVDWQRDSDRLESVQRWATRISYGRSRPPY
uniref:Uncharacterized protein LOC114325864 n=1 Tax=Diabrotica virgifera virgifera TaxID=50390 RepID=A0A6P7F8M3_DIAVI